MIGGELSIEQRVQSTRGWAALCRVQTQSKGSIVELFLRGSLRVQRLLKPAAEGREPLMVDACDVARA